MSDNAASKENKISITKKLLGSGFMMAVIAIVLVVAITLAWFSGEPPTLRGISVRSNIIEFTCEYYIDFLGTTGTDVEIDGALPGKFYRLDIVITDNRIRDIEKAVEFTFSLKNFESKMCDFVATAAAASSGDPVVKYYGETEPDPHFTGEFMNDRVRRFYKILVPTAADASTFGIPGTVDNTTGIYSDFNYGDVNEREIRDKDANIEMLRPKPGDLNPEDYDNFEDTLSNSAYEYKLATLWDITEANDGVAAKFVWVFEPDTNQVQLTLFFWAENDNVAGDVGIVDVNDYQLSQLIMNMEMNSSIIY